MSVDKCPLCGATAIVVATVLGGDDPHETLMCRAWKRCGAYFRRQWGAA